MLSNGSFANPKWTELSLGDLMFFLRLVEEKSLTEAAKAQGISLSTTSRVLKMLRDVFDDPLFLRSSPQLIPTQRAFELEPEVRALLGAAGALVKPEVFRPADLERSFRIGVVDNAVYAVMRGFVKRFLEAAPRAGLEFVQIDDHLFEKLETGEIDAAIYPSSRKLPAGMHELKLIRMGYALCTRPNHPIALKWRETGRIPWKDVNRCRKIQVSNRGSSQYEIYSMDEKTVVGEELLDRAIAVPFFLVVPGILEETDCVAVLPLLTARLFESEGRIAVMPLHPQTELGRGRETFWARLIWHERVDRDPAMAWLRGLIKANAERIGDCLDAGADDAEEQ